MNFKYFILIHFGNDMFEEIHEVLNRNNIIGIMYYIVPVFSCFLSSDLFAYF